jgi:hypothetical protein
LGAVTAVKEQIDELVHSPFGSLALILAKAMLAQRSVAVTLQREGISRLIQS